MGTWKVPVDILAESRFAISTLAEVVGSLNALRSARTPEQRAFRAAHGAAFHDWLADRPVVVDLVRASFRKIQAGRFGLMADFLGMPPPWVARTSFEAELEQLCALTDDEVRADLAATAKARLSPTLLGPGVRDALVDLVVWLWTHTVETDWTRREQVLRADIVARTDQLARNGWGSVLHDLGRDQEWVGNGELRINRFDRPAVSLPAGSRLTFVPTSHSSSWAGWYHNHYAVYYPVTGRLAAVDGSHGAGLGPLIGESRAQLLRLLEGPRSTTQLVALSNQTLGAVGRHLKILLGAGAVLRRRSGREVLYWRTPLGDSLVASGATPQRRTKSATHRAT
ncbi:transcriptional regulator [Kribbella capetownensis]|uniref:Transcriptional regulator n=1 Tax=Kribbella capetownensis TaxID=1572659 RepID=A0A4R0JYI2_9ACTN|nr:helix-turn-helix transcriptional regulator [Kribbella capetownensis]TCC47445.1 transcriptional regulator [Kribbella capetownensis]